MTRRTSLFAPDDGVEVNPQPRDQVALDFGDLSDLFGDSSETDQEDDEEVFSTDINDARPTTHWLGRDFVLAGRSVD